jgi:dethiobiotin synthetase
MSRAVFITGTSTDVGKTFVSGLILKKLRAGKVNAGYYKAALSGAEGVGGELIPATQNMSAAFQALKKILKRWFLLFTKLRFLLILPPELNADRLI